MNKRRTFGNTWWGKQWIEAFSNVDHDNRLQQGRICYLHGDVESLEWIEHEQHLEAFVSGSAYFPYQVDINLPKWSDKKITQLLDTVAQNPQLVAELLEGTLPPVIADICNKINLELFPRNWRSIHTRCTCSDNPHICKHIAAVFYCLSEHIDADPFLIFKLHGLDLRRELQNRGIDLQSATTARPLSFSELALAATDQLTDPEKINPETALEQLRRLPYGTITSLRETVLSLLPVSLPTLGNEAFRDNIRKLFLAAEQTLKRVPLYENSLDWFADCITPHLHSQGISFNQETLQTLKLALNVKATDNNEFGAVLRVCIRDTDERVRKITLTDPADIFEIILKTPSTWSQQADPVFECWREITQLAARLLAKAVVVPALVAPRGKPLSLPLFLWTPAVRDAQAARLMELMIQACEPFASKLLTRTTKSENVQSAKTNVFLAVSTAISALMKLAAANCRTVPTTQSILLLLAMQTPMETSVEIPTAFFKSMLYGLRAFLLGSAYPWRPVLTVRLHQDGLKINYGILGREIAIESKTLSTKRPVMLSRLLQEARFRNERFAALSVLKTLASACPMLSAIADSQGKPITLKYEELKPFLFEIAPTLTLLGVTVMLPSSLKNLLKPRLVAHLQKGTGKSLLGKDAFSSFDWRVAIGDRELTLEELRELASHAGQIVPVGEDFVYLDPEQLQQLIKTVSEQPQPTYLEKMRAALCGMYEKNGLHVQVRVSEEIIKRLQRLTSVEEIATPTNLHATLRPYQRRGFSWLMKNLRLGIGALIADDMGLGKTLQVIAALLQLKNDGELQQHKALIVVPTTLMTNWSREITKFAPSLSVGIYHGLNRTLPTDTQDLPDLTLTSYGLMRRDLEKLTAYKWRLLVLDEAQALKNATSGQAIAAKAIQATQTIAMTGTPVENRLNEYWSILETVQPRLLGSVKDFNDTFVYPIEVDHDPSAIEAFRRLTAPFMLRRLKSDKSIISDLPERNTIDQFTHLSKEQAALYHRVLDEHLKKLKILEEKAVEDPKTVDYQTARRGQLLKLITSMKQICNSPSQYLKTNTTLPDSGKAAALFDILERCREANRKVLIFTQYREMGERLQSWIHKSTGETPDFLHGGVPIRTRQNMIDRFQTNRTVHTMIISLKAGGTGLNLTAASCVIHYDLWWNPAVEAQATDRAYRIGQRRDVIVYRFVTAGTFEEKINEMLEHKRELADMTVATGETWIGELTTTELKALFSLDTSALGN